MAGYSVALAALFAGGMIRGGWIFLPAWLLANVLGWLLVRGDGRYPWRWRLLAFGPLCLVRAPLVRSDRSGPVPLSEFDTP